LREKKKTNKISISATNIVKSHGWDMSAVMASMKPGV